MRKPAVAFLALAIAFLAIGLSGQRTFMYVGTAFLVAALLAWSRRRG